MIFNIIIALLGCACVGYYLAMGIGIRFGQSLDFLWLIFALIFFARHVVFALFVHKGKAVPLAGRFIKLMHIGLIAFLVSFIAVEGIIMSACFSTAPSGLDYIVVLGAKVNGTQPGGALRNRIQVAYEYWEQNPDTLIIASGGQGDDEGISEAECIFNSLTQKGVPAESIILEDKSTSTYENLSNSMELIEGEDARIGIVTNNFHIYRSLKIAQGIGGAEFHGIYVHTSHLSFPHYMLREYFGVIYGWITGSW